MTQLVLGLLFAIWTLNLTLLVRWWPSGVYRAVLPIWRRLNRPAAKVALRRLAADTERRYGWPSAVEYRRELVRLQIARPDWLLFPDVAALGLVLMSAGQRTEAREAFQAVLQNGNPETQRNWIGLARFGLAMSDGADRGPIPDVLAECEAAVDMLRSDAEPAQVAYALRAQAVLRAFAGRLQEAAADLEESARLDDRLLNQAAAANGQAWLHLRAGEPEEAAQALAEARKRVLDFPRLAMYVSTTEARLLLARGQRKEARSLLRAILQERQTLERAEDPTGPDLLLARIELEEGNREEASKMLSDALPLIRDFESRKLAQDLEADLGSGFAPPPADRTRNQGSDLIEAVTVAARVAPSPPSKWRIRLQWSTAWLYVGLLALGFLLSVAAGAPQSTQSSPFWLFLIGGTIVVAVASTLIGRTDRGRSFVSIASLGCLSFSGLVVGALAMIVVFGGALRVSNDRLIPLILLGATVGMILPLFLILRRGRRPATN